MRLARASDAAVAGIGGFCDEHGIQAHYRRAGWFWTATNQAQVGAWESTIAAIERQGAKPFQRMDPDEVAARTGSPRHLAGVFEPGSATVQPALLVRGLLRVARTRGVQVFERSPVVAIERAGPLTVRTDRGLRHRRPRRAGDGGLGESAARAAPRIRDRLERHGHHRPGCLTWCARGFARRPQHL